MEGFIHKYLTEIFLFFLFVNLSFGDQSEECVNLIWRVRNCTLKMHLPDSCEKPTKSKSLICAEEVAKKSPTCSSDVAKRLISNYVTTFRNSDKVICESKMHSELMENRRCIPLTKTIVSSIGVAAPGFLTVKGCKYLKSVIYLISLAHMRMACLDVVEDYMNALYSKTSCASVEIENPTYKDVEDVQDVLKKLVVCWFIHTDFPKCGEESSQRVQCVEKLNVTTLKNPHLNTVAENLILVTKVTDKLICEDKKLKNDFLKSPDCWKAIRLMGILMLEQVNGYYTKDGCENLNYREIYKMALFKKSCRPLLQEYRKAMHKRLPCAPEESVSSAKKVENMSIIYVSLLLLFNYCKLFCLK